ncbi:MAG TPA: SPFH domain-containing protein, partial [Spirochaetia bacterium]|nr:SPFH domain-containing protein [Spirochaetia bacterium]
MNTEPLMEEKPATRADGMAALALNVVLTLASTAGTVLGIIALDRGDGGFGALALTIACGLYASVIGPVLFGGLRILKPNEALVLTLFGR